MFPDFEMAGRHPRRLFLREPFDHLVFGGNDLRGLPRKTPGSWIPRAPAGFMGECYSFELPQRVERAFDLIAQAPKSAIRRGRVGWNRTQSR